MCLFFFNDTATTEIYTLSLHDALPILGQVVASGSMVNEHVKDLSTIFKIVRIIFLVFVVIIDRKSTRLNSSHANISYAVFCLKKKKKNLTKLDSRQAFISRHTWMQNHS